MCKALLDALWRDVFLLNLAPLRSAPPDPREGFRGSPPLRRCWLRVAEHPDEEESKAPSARMLAAGLLAQGGDATRGAGIYEDLQDWPKAAVRPRTGGDGQGTRQLAAGPSH